MDAIQINSHKNKLIEGPLLLKPNIFNDDRGYFYESWNKKSLEKLVFENLNFVQDNHSKSKLGVLRGMHFQIPPKAQAKLVRCTHGEIFDVIVDLRMNSKTFGEWYGVYLNENNKFQLWIPKGFAHGFLSLKNFSEVQYKTNEYWDKSAERSLKWDDEEINIEWPLKIDKKFLEIFTNEKDSNCLNFNEIKKKEYFYN